MNSSPAVTRTIPARQPGTGGAVSEAARVGTVGGAAMVLGGGTVVGDGWRRGTGLATAPGEDDDHDPGEGERRDPRDDERAARDAGDPEDDAAVPLERALDDAGSRAVAAETGDPDAAPTDAAAPLAPMPRVR